MNLGYLTGYFADYRIVSTQYIATGMFYRNVEVTPDVGRVYAPREASVALVTAFTAGGVSATAGWGGGGGGACCFRVAFPLGIYRFIPYKIYQSSIDIGAVSGLSAGTPIYEGMHALALTGGAAGAAANGGNGGAITYQFRHASSTTSTITVSGGTGGTTGVIGGDGRVIMLGNGGILASGAGGALDTHAGCVPAPWGTQVGGRYSTVGTGGASLFSHGGSGQWNLPGTNYASGAAWHAPGAGASGAAAINATSVRGPCAMYVEFISQAEL